MFNNFFLQSYNLWDNAEKVCIHGEDTDENIIWRMRIACWITKDTDTHSEYVTMVFHGKNCSCESASVLRYTYIACLVRSSVIQSWTFWHIKQLNYVNGLHCWTQTDIYCTNTWNGRDFYSACADRLHWLLRSVHVKLVVLICCWYHCREEAWLHQLSCY